MVNSPGFKRARLSVAYISRCSPIQISGKNGHLRHKLLANTENTELQRRGLRKHFRYESANRQKAPRRSHQLGLREWQVANYDLVSRRAETGWHALPGARGRDSARTDRQNGSCEQIVVSPCSVRRCQARPDELLRSLPRRKCLDECLCVARIQLLPSA